MPRQALLAWIVTAIEISLDLREPWRAMSSALRGLRVAPLNDAAWRILIKSMKACMRWTAASAKGLRVGDDTSVVLRSYPARALRNHTGNKEPDRVVCIPLMHKEGYCLSGGNYMVPESGRYHVTFEITIDAYSFAQDPLAVLDVYEIRETKSVLAERRISLADLAGKPHLFNIEFHAKKEQRLDFRVYWNEQCFLTASKIVLRKLQ